MSRLAVAATTCTALIALLAPIALQPVPRLVWNASVSAPPGLYTLQAATPRVGDLVLVATPRSVADLAADRGYIPQHVPLIKQIAAGQGSFVCTRGDAVQVDDTPLVLRTAFDAQRRPLPYWEGCRRLVRGELFLLMPRAPHSFDSRYFGPVRTSAVIGVLRPLWTF